MYMLRKGTPAYLLLKFSSRVRMVICGSFQLTTHNQQSTIAVNMSYEITSAANATWEV